MRRSPPTPRRLAEEVAALRQAADRLLALYSEAHDLAYSVPRGETSRRAPGPADPTMAALQAGEHTRARLTAAATDVVRCGGILNAADARLAQAIGLPAERPELVWGKKRRRRRKGGGYRQLAREILS